MTASARLAMIFSCVGHFYIHMMTAFYFVIVLTLVVEWDQPYSELLRLWTIASALLALLAIPAGRLADRWSVRGTMVIFFIGMGLSSVVCGLVSTNLALLLALSGIGIFGAIYHPVGIPWLIRSATRNTGKILAVNGIFGSLGNAGAAVIAGVLIDLYGWRMTFIIPGVVCAMTGLWMWWYVLRDGIVDGTSGGDSDSENVAKGDFIRVALLLLVAIAVGGVIYQSTQTALPKHFATELKDWSLHLFGFLSFDTKTATGLGTLVSIVYSSSIAMQYVGGALADRFPLKYIYTICWFLQIGMLAALSIRWGSATKSLAGTPPSSIRTIPRISAPPSLIRPRRSSLKAWRTRVGWWLISKRSLPLRTTRVFHSSSTTRWPRPISANRSSTARTLLFTRLQSFSPATGAQLAAVSSIPAISISPAAKSSRASRSRPPSITV